MSKLIYGLETIQPTVGAARALDTLHLKGLRKILELKMTFINRANTNEIVDQKAQDVFTSKMKPNQNITGKKTNGFRDK